MRELVVTDLVRGKRRLPCAALFEDGRLSELAAPGEEEQSLVGRIYMAEAETDAPEIGGAFLRIGKKMRVFLPLKHGKVRISSVLPVQITKDAAGRKEPVAGRNLHLAGKYAVLSRNPGKTAFSSKLTEEEKTLLRKWLADQPEVPYQVLVRTNAARCRKDELLAEIGVLASGMDEILKAADKSPCGKCLYAPEPFYVRLLRDLKEAPDRIVTDVPLYLEQLAPYAKEAECVLYEDGRTLSLAGRYRLPEHIEKLLGKLVWLRSGAFLVIEQTEAFVSIDVNTGHSTKGRIPEETYRRINLEAAEEIARQLRLRNLSGMILVDFISMRSEDHKDELFHVMAKLLKKDRVKAEAVDLTKLGILEIVRTKAERPLKETAGPFFDGNRGP